MKNIVLYCDGTANEFAQNKTNVVKLFSTLVQDTRQIAYYHPGLGTMEPPGALTNVARKVGGLELLVFTGGIGEKTAPVRWETCKAWSTSASSSNESEMMPARTRSAPTTPAVSFE